MKREKTGESNIYRHANGTYYYRSGGVEKSLKTKNKKIALQKRDALEAKLSDFGQGAFVLTVESVYDEYLEFRTGELENGEISEVTLKEMRDCFRLHLLDFFGQKKFFQIDESLWLDYCQSKIGIDLMNHRKVFSYFLNWAKIKGYYRYSLKMAIPKVKRRERPVHPPEVCKKILENSKGSLRLFLSMYLFMGMRRSEIMKLSWDRVSLEHGVILLKRENTKTRRGRQVPINPFVLELLRLRYGRQKEGIASPWVFPNRKDPKRHADPSGLKTAWHTVLRKTGLSEYDIQWHDLRATHQYYSHKATDFTDTQREKFSGSAIEVQKRHYVSFSADDVRGLETVVKFDGLNETLESALGEELGKNTGKVKNAET